MQFITLQFFLFFLGVFIVAILLKENKKYYRWFLLVVSLSFYLFFGVNFFIILLLSIGFNYFLLKVVDGFGKKTLIFSVALNVIFLAAFKYYNFGIDTLLQTLNYFHIPSDIKVLRILIPVGISFYIFRIISHQVDCYRKELPVPSLVDYANYIAFFPQIMSGPIVRAKEFYTYLNEPKLFTYSQGRIITLILSGLVKKYVIASYLFNYVSAPFASPSNYSTLDLITSSVAYSMMIFVDFSGYSDFAIAISNLLGFHVQRNFLSPYSAIGLKDFWSRWHISLSTWLRDYIYIPLGGSRKGETRKYINILLTMFISGLWHGAGLNFVIWGLLHGIGSVVSHYISNLRNWLSDKGDEGMSLFIFERYELELGVFKNITNKDEKIFTDVDNSEYNFEVEKLVENIHEDNSVQTNFEKFYIKNFFPKILDGLGWIVTFIYVTFAWIFFNSTSFANALEFIKSIFVSSIHEHKIFNFRLLIVICIVLLFNFIGSKSFQVSIGFFDKLPMPIRIIIVAILTYLILQLGPETMPPFIYFSF
jgi:D-alanyl-lipoteichoic acid acyltransferase DltB (MBOAT superfamily)